MKKNLLKIKHKNSHSCLIEIDEKVRGVLPQRSLSDLSFEFDKGFNVDDETVQMIEEEIVLTTRRKFLNWLARSERSEGECRQYLKKFPLAGNLADPIIADMKEDNYINDDRFIEIYIGYLTERGKSRLEVAHKLREKYLSEEQVSQGLKKHYNDAKQIEVLDNLINSLLDRWHYEDDDRRKNRICNYLNHRGYNYSEVEKIYEKVYAEKSSESK